MKLSRRRFLGTTLKASAISTIVSPAGLSIYSSASKNNKSDLTQFQFKQYLLSYSYDALEPYIDAKTMDIHYNRHHALYVKNVNEAIVEESVNVSSEQELFNSISNMSDWIRNNAGGAWNHNFFWSAMTGKKGESPSGKVIEALNNSFGSIELFKEKFKLEALARFGSGWVWLVKDSNQLRIGSTPNQDNPLMDTSDLKGTPILALDVWEHAYYLLYQNKRNEYIDNWWKVVSWGKVAELL